MDHHQFMALKRVAKLKGYHSPTFRQKYKSRYSLESRHWDLSINTINFPYWQMKAFFKAEFYQKVTILWLTINHPVWDWNRDFKPIGKYKNTKTRFSTKKKVFNQLVECKNIKIIWINYHFKLQFHTVQANIYQFNDSNDLFGPIVIFLDRSIVLLLLYSFCRLIVN